MATKTISAAPFSFLGLLVGTLVPFALAIAIFADGSWQFNVNPLSDLGISWNAFAANVFNFTCMVAGIALSIFGIGMLLIRDGADAAVGFFTAVGGVLLFAIGLFTENYSIHTIIAYSYFAIVALAVIIGVVADGLKGRKLKASICATLVVICMGAGIGYTIPGLEVVTVLCVCAWVIVQSYSLAFAKD